MAQAGTVTKVTKNSFDGMSVEWSWTANATGDVDEWPFTANGYLVQIDYYPGTAADDYDVTLLDSDSLDLLDGTGANMQQSGDITLATKYFNPLSPGGNYYFFFNENITPTINNGGNGGTGKIVFKFTRTRP
jgi:hypothetical protein